jgi:hypothetical protein
VRTHPFALYQRMYDDFRWPTCCVASPARWQTPISGW